MSPEFDLIRRSLRREDLTADLIVAGFRRVDADGLVAADRSGDRGEDPFDLFQGLRPAIGVPGRPGEPDCFLCLPFSGHAVTKFFRGHVESSKFQVLSLKFGFAVSRRTIEAIQHLNRI